MRLAQSVKPDRLLETVKVGFNLGHGIHPDVNPDHATALVEAVHELGVPYHQSRCH